MPVSRLSKALQDTLMVHHCPYCGYATTRRASGFQRIKYYKCSACYKKVQLTYTDKLKLFREHAEKPVSGD